jgi:polyhydroxyalkanoate synthesis regulator phasin
MTKERKLKFAAGATAVATIVVGLGAAGAVAASKAFSPSEESKAVIEDAAGQLGVEPDALSNALKRAAKNRLDAAVAAGRLTKEQANALKERIDSGDGVPPFGGMGGDPNPGHFGHFGQIGNLEAAAAYLGLTGAELREQLADKTLAEIAKAEGKSVNGLVQTLVVTAQKAIDEAVADGKLTQEQADDVKAKLKDHIEDLVNGEFPHGGLMPHPGLEPGSGSPRAPPPFFGGPNT